MRTVNLVADLAVDLVMSTWAQSVIASIPRLMISLRLFMIGFSLMISFEVAVEDATLVVMVMEFGARNTAATFDSLVKFRRE